MDPTSIMVVTLRPRLPWETRAMLPLPLPAHPLRPPAAIAPNRMVRAIPATSPPPMTTRSIVPLRQPPPGGRRSARWPSSTSLLVARRPLPLALPPPDPGRALLLLALTGVRTLTSVGSPLATSNVKMVPGRSTRNRTSSAPSSDATTSRRISAPPTSSVTS
jgi:hypothetical protein